MNHSSTLLKEIFDWEILLKTDINFVTYLPGFRGEITEKAEQFSFEARFASDHDGPLNYVLGGFYFKEDQNALNFFRQGNISTTRFNPRLETESLAVFGQQAAQQVDDEQRDGARDQQRGAAQHQRVLADHAQRGQ